MGGNYLGLLLSSLLGLLCGVGLGALSALLGAQAVSGLGSAAFLFVIRLLYQDTFLKVHSSRETLAFLTGCVVTAVFLTGFVFSVHWISFHDPPLSLARYTSLYGGAGMLMASFVYYYYRLCCQEDERKHQLRVINPVFEGQALNATNGQMVDSDRPIEVRVSQMMRFFKWIVTCRWLADLQDDGVDRSKLSQDIDTETGGQIVVENRTLKLVKACLYAAEDYPCWIPFGGVSGRGVAFILAEQRYAFNPPRGSGLDGDFTLKVFQPGLFDKELASFPNAKRGQSFAFVDVDGMVKRQGPSQKKVAALVEDAEDSDTSDDDKERPTLLTSPVMKAATALPRSPLRCPAEPVELPPPGGLRRIFSQDSVRPINLSQVSPKSHGLAGRTPNDKEILLRNGSKEEIKACLFRPNDYCCWVPLDGQPQLQSSDGDGASGIVKHGEEMMFNPIFQAQEFTLKVYSVGPGTKELTYCTVERGHTYIFRDSTLC